ncbi:MAG: 2Fe-2S iron-sulfur cluster-binding protein [Nitrospinota bacterium]
MAREEVRLRVFRFDPNGAEKPTYSSYTIPGSGFSLLSALEFIYENLDSSLAFRNFCCYQLICGSCLLRLNGSHVKGCAAVLKAGRSYTVEPPSGFPIIRDLLVDFGRLLYDEELGGYCWFARGISLKAPGEGGRHLSLWRLSEGRGSSSGEEKRE